ncbi:MAG: hypothetical protein PHU85_05305 [Phycisphaerae bacterium]|nr:hypothetical protein [Phycisphaerae bacterium]
MKQFIKQNTFIVATVGVTLLAGLIYIFPMVKFSQATENAAQMSRLSDQLRGATSHYESPDWIKQSEVGIERIRAIQEQVIEASLKFGTRAPLLVKGNLIFPAPEQAPRFEFASAYLESLAAFRTKLGADTLPTQAEVDKAVADEKDRLTKQHAEIPKDLAAGVRAALVSKRAGKIRLWAGEAAFDDYVAKNMANTVTVRMTNEQLWEALLNYWVQKDIVDAIAALNSQPTGMIGGKAAPAPSCVLESPVKELVRISVDRLYYPQTGSGTALTPTVTGHVTDANYDVLHYRFVVVIDSRRIAELVDQLSSRNFHTLLSLKYETLDKKPPMAAVAPGEGKTEMVDYGNGNVILATLSCEAIFMKSPRSWRDNPEQGRKKRAAFLSRNDKENGDNRKLVLEVHRVAPDGSVQVELAQKDIAANQPKLDELLKKALDGKDPSLRFIALYEDLMPDTVRTRSPGLGNAAARPKP